MIRRVRALSGFTGRKEMRRRSFKFLVKSYGSTISLRGKLGELRKSEESGIPGGAVKCVDIGKNIECEGSFLGLT